MLCLRPLGSGEAAAGGGAGAAGGGGATPSPGGDTPFQGAAAGSGHTVAEEQVPLIIL